MSAQLVCVEDLRLFSAQAQGASPHPLQSPRQPVDLDSRDQRKEEACEIVEHAPDRQKAGRATIGRPAGLCGQSVRSLLMSGRGQNPQGPAPGNRFRPTVDAQFAIDIARVGLDRVQ